MRFTHGNCVARSLKRVAFVFQVVQRGLQKEEDLAAATTVEERAAQREEFAEYMRKCRREVEDEDLEEVREVEGMVEDFMAARFKTYVPLKNHLMRYQMRNVVFEFSKETPASLKSKYNLYLGGGRVRGGRG